MSFRDESSRVPRSEQVHGLTSHKITATRISANTVSKTEDFVVDETPVALIYNGEPHVVMLATPCNLKDFAIGFSLTEGIIKQVSEIVFMEITPCESGIQIHIRTNQDTLESSDIRKRNLTGRTGCGLCGTALIEEAVRNTPEVNTPVEISTDIIFKSLAVLEQYQPINKLTGAIHAAAWVNSVGDILTLREDVGRHNSLDKLIGALHSQNLMDLSAGFVIITSRASYEMVTKAAFAGVAVLVAISAPTSLAINIAEKSNITLVGFARDNSCVVYTHSERIKRI
ncbi:MAG: FdhD protein [Gammaproteobacteria bacterium]|jgi:FdhD protein